MRNILLLLILGLSCLCSNGQERKNAIKVLPLSFPLNSSVVEYERMLNEKNSVEIGLGIPNQQSFGHKFGTNMFDDEEITNDKLGIFSLRAAYRHYTGKSMLPKGFYIAPYIRLLTIDASADNLRTIEDDLGSMTYNEDYDAKINTVGVGFQLGYQFLISKRVTLDLFFFGLEAGLGKVDTGITISDPEQVDAIYGDVQDAVNDFPSFLNSKIDVTKSGNKVSINGENLIYPMYRGGFSLGVAF